MPHDSDELAAAEQAAGRPAARPEPLNSETPLSALGQFITPAEERFVRCHFPVPRLAQDHPLFVGGAVAHPLQLSLEELRGLHATTMTVTTECAGNGRDTLAPRVDGEPWRMGAVSTAQWTGVPLSEVLARAGLKETAVEILFAGADRGALPDGSPGQFARSLPVEKALDSGTLIAWEMNGEPIPPQFGGPLRLVVPGWYGMASVKWLERIEALEQPFSGEFQTAKYVYAPGQPVTEVRVKSMFIEPSSTSIVRRGAVQVRGLAWAGQALAKVEVAVGCTDRDWREARLLGPALPHAWRRFELIWKVSAPGRHVLRCRATDISGESQPDSPEWNALGYGANAVQQIAVTVL